MFWLVLILFLYVLYLLLSPNPFERRLPFKRRYKVRISCNRVFSNNAAYISFSPNANAKDFRDALFNAVYLDSDVSEIVIESQTCVMGSYDVFKPFSFFTLDFSNVLFIENRFPRLNEVNCFFPCSVLILPKTVNKVRFAEDCHTLTGLVLPSDEIVVPEQLQHMDSLDIYVASDFSIYVPGFLLDSYRNNMYWSMIIVHYPDGRTGPIQFFQARL